MSWQGDAANFGRAAVQDVKEHTLALSHAHRFAVAQHATVDGEIAIAHFIAVQHPLRERGFHRGLTSRFKYFDARSGSQKIHRHVAALAERWFELFEDEKHLPVVASRLVSRFYVNRSNLATVLSSVKLGTCPIARVIEAKTGGTRSEHNPSHPVRRDERCPFFRRAIHIRGNELSMPMQLLRGVRIVVYFHRNRLAIFEAQQRSWELTVVRDCRHNAFRCDLDRRCGDSQGIVRWS